MGADLLPLFIAAYAALGLLTGFLAGLLGVGGGLILVPVLIFHLEHAGLAVGFEPQVALATSLAAIVFTALSSVRAHHAHGAIDWALARRMGAGALVGTFAGALVAAAVPAYPLKVFFVGFLAYAALQMALDFKPAPHREPPGTLRAGVAGSLIGAVSSWVGIGGGTLSVPFMLWHNLPLRRAIATSAAIGLPIALAGAAGYIAGGWARVGLPPGSAGFVWLPALAGIVAGSVLTAPFGARVAHRVPVKWLKRFFALLLGVLAVRMASTL